MRVLGEYHHLSDGFSGIWGTLNTCEAEWDDSSFALFTLKHQEYSAGGCEGKGAATVGQLVVPIREVQRITPVALSLWRQILGSILTLYRIITSKTFCPPV